MKVVSLVIVMCGVSLGIGMSFLLPQHQYSPQVEWLEKPRPVSLLSMMQQSTDWKLVALGYTRCPDVCPTTLSAMALVTSLTDLPTDNFFLSVDGVSQSIVSQYASAFDPSILGVTGAPLKVRQFASSVGAQYQLPTQVDGPVAHSSFLILIDPTGMMRGRIRMGFDVVELAEELNQIGRKS